MLGQSRARRPLILSASRRTDLPGFYPDRLVARIEKRVRGLRVYEIYGVVFWTKHLEPLLRHSRLRRLFDSIENPVLNLTVTGLGGTRWEPGTPATAEILPLLSEVVRGPLQGQPERLRWRFDPIWPRPGLLGGFAGIADAFAALGVPTCTFSFPTGFCQLGSMATCYQRIGLRVPDRSERADILAALYEQASPRSIRLLSCAQPENLCLLPAGAVEEAQCIPRDVLEGLHPRGLFFPDKRDPSQRKACRCLPSEDVGSYRDDPCGSGCLYCYSKAGGPRGREEFQAMLS